MASTVQESLIPEQGFAPGENNINAALHGRLANSTKETSLQKNFTVNLVPVGSKVQVFDGSAERTAGGLKKANLMKTSTGRIVSKKAHAAGVSAIQRLRNAGFVAKKGEFKLFSRGQQAQTAPVISSLDNQSQPTKSFQIKIGSKVQVFDGSAERTAGGLKKANLMKTSTGRIVSKKQYNAGVSAIQCLRNAGFVAKKGEFKLFSQESGFKKQTRKRKQKLF